jgi:hypothetical protein
VSSVLPAQRAQPSTTQPIPKSTPSTEVRVPAHEVRKRPNSPWPSGASNTGAPIVNAKNMKKALPKPSKPSTRGNILQPPGSARARKLAIPKSTKPMHTNSQIDNISVYPAHIVRRPPFGRGLLTYARCPDRQSVPFRTNYLFLAARSEDLAKLL